ncbi:hypothetical protein BKI52_40680 [marine bacterium AO1-C]|nr:hypothetical protein BKI52_40680 [marine bacterium AO1-C]
MYVASDNSTPMNEKVNFLKLLHSTEEKNVLIALQIAKNQPQFQEALIPYLTIQRQVYNKVLTIDTIEAQHIRQLNDPWLDWDNANLETLPPEMLHLPNPEELFLDGNLFADIPSLVLQSMQSLKRLGLGYNQLTSISPDIQSLQELQTLYLYNNQLTTLPKEIGNLTNLRRLLLDGNQLQSLPDEIGNLEKLECLSVSENALKTLPASIGKLKNLKNLCLDSNQLTELPEEIGQMTSLEELRIQANQLQHAHAIPKSVEQLPNLTAIYYSENPVDWLDIYLPNGRIVYGWNDNGCP